MAGIFKNIFKHKENKPTPPIENNDPTFKLNPNFLTDTYKIKQLLEGIEKESLLCTVSIEGIKEQFSSSVLELQTDKGLMIIDELMPSHGNDLLNIVEHIKISTTYQGIKLAFQLSKLEKGISDGISYYKAALPQRIYYPQRRNSPRLQVSNLNLSLSGISSRTNASIGGFIFDLSRTGIGIVSTNNRARIQRGDLITNCRIHINEETVDCNLQIRFIKTTPPGTSKVLIGGSFENMTAKNQKNLEHFVASLEREEIRKQKDQESEPE